ncbi:hypothetical protein LTR37_019859 [Vermiconidia calcicola]|uniref:Uncharacterized protein n=1 Tax=Vermiconidia calcicola TaxID=1690605 RepID=A0ACC3MD26_9PEZI|nr:hypothetical protein LTR37_019859 [Vermiconidia calcicola]
MPAYRLNLFGFLASKELEAEAKTNGEAAGNMGFWDQRTALEWTAKNISFFGGDSNKITVGGYSAGAHSAFHQLAHELLFVPDDKAIIKRTISWSNSPGVQPRTVLQHQKQFEELLGSLDISLSLSAKEKLEKLRATSVQDLVEVQEKLKISEFRATSDDAFVSKQLMASINSGDFARRMKARGIKFMNGECRDEHNLYQSWRTPSNSYDAVRTRLVGDYPETVVDKLMLHYCGKAKKLPPGVKDWPEIFGLIYADMQVHSLERGLHRALSKGGLVYGKDVFRYRFEWRAKCVDSNFPPEWGVTHATDMAIWFWGLDYGSGLSDQDKMIVKPFNEAFAAFVKGEDLRWDTSNVKEMKRLRSDVPMNSLQFASQFPAISNKMISEAQPFQMSNHSQPHIQYFISRSNNTLVPLIPADELPFNIRLQGVPRVLNFDQTIGMQHVGSALYTGLTFKLENDMSIQRSTSQPPTTPHTRSHSSSVSKQFLPPDALARQALANSSNTLQQSLPQRPLSAHELATNWRKAPTSDPADNTQDVIDAIVSTRSGAEAAARIGYQSGIPVHAPSGIVPDPEKKVYCTHWIKTGNCDYAQQGCLYKHEMPETLEKLESIGIGKHWPRWWAEKNQKVRSLTTKAPVGPKVPAAVWLKQGKSNESEAGSDSEDDSVEPEVRSLRSSEQKRSAETKTTKATEAVHKPSTVFTVPDTIATKTRQPSAAVDLLDFAPLLPTPSPTTASASPSSSTDGSPRSGTSTPLTLPDDEPKQARSDEVRTAHRVFVPAGESTEQHIAEAKKHATRNKATRTCSEKPLKVRTLEEQIQIMQKNKNSSGLMESNHAPVVVPSKNVSGFPAPKHAPGVASSRTERPVGVRQRVPKAKSSVCAGEGKTSTKS